MNKEETLTLYSQGKGAWNAWAKEILARRDDSQEWRNEAEVDFRSHTFQQCADFSEFIFPGKAQFDRVAFRDSVKFGGGDLQGQGSV